MCVVTLRAFHLTVVMVGIGIFGGPKAANAQLGTYCGYASAWCFNLTGLDFSYTAEKYIVALTGSFEGNAFDGLTGLVGEGFFTPVLWAGASADPTAFLPGETVTLSSVTWRASDDIYPRTEVQPLDLNFRWYDNGEWSPYKTYERSCDGEGGNLDGPICDYTPVASVPEPTAFLLTITGMLGIALIACRRETA